MWRRLAVSLGLVLAGCSSVAAVAPAATASSVGARSSFAGRVTLPGGRRIYLECRGRGSPTVIFESGLRNRADIWSEPLEPTQRQVTVFPAVARLSRVCAYDRPGTTIGTNATSRSDPVRMPRTARDAVADLHALLRAARIRGPYVLVGHSTGGLLVRLYAGTFPREVVGLVLADAISEALPRFMTISQWNAYDSRYLVAPPSEFADYANLEIFDFVASFAQTRRVARPPRKIPLFVLSKGLSFGIPGPLGVIVDRAWRKGQNYLASLLPHTPHVIATRSGHYIQVEQPQLVIGAVRRVLNQARRAQRSTR